MAICVVVLALCAAAVDILGVVCLALALPSEAHEWLDVSDPFEIKRL